MKRKKTAHRAIGAMKKAVKKSICAPIRRRNTPARTTQAWVWVLCCFGTMLSDLTVTATAIARAIIRAAYRIGRTWEVTLPKVVFRGAVLGGVLSALHLKSINMLFI